jgi:hypothetical protein
MNLINLSSAIINLKHYLAVFKRSKYAKTISFFLEKYFSLKITLTFHLIES